MIRLFIAVGLMLLAPSAFAQPCPASWSPEFPAGDFDGNIRASAVYNDGTGAALYVAGCFTRAGGVHAQGVARWTGTTWAPVGGDFNGEVNALHVHTDGSLYAGGVFTMVGQSSVTRVARWNNSAWVGVSSGTLGGTVRALASFTNQNGVSSLWVGGQYLYYQSIFNMGFAGMLSGNAWDFATSHSPTNFSVNCLATINESGVQRMYAGGTDGQTSQGNFLRFNSNSWTAVPSGLNGPVYALKPLTVGSKTALYAGGAFTNAGGFPANHIGRWDGASWSAVGAGVPYTVRALANFDPDGFGPLPMRIYAGGDSSAQGGPTVSLSSWDGNAWAPYGSGTNDRILSLTPFNLGNGLFVGGGYSIAQGAPTSRAGYISNTTGWNTMHNAGVGNAPSEIVNATAWFDDDGPGPHPGKLYVAGDFHSAGTVPANYIAAWDGTSWSALPAEPNDVIQVLRVFDDGSGPALYAGGWFTAVGETAATRIARWNGQTWSALGAGLPAPVFALESFAASSGPPRLYAGGFFFFGSNRGVANWDGVSWNPLPSSSSIQDVYALKSFQDQSGPRLYIGGATTSSNGVMSWDGTSLIPAGNGLWSVSFVTSFAVLEGTLYVGGRDLTVNGDTVARLVGSTWTPVPNAPRLQVTAMAAHDDGTGPALYASSYAPTNSAGQPADRFARFNGTSWSNFGGAVQPEQSSIIQALTSIDEDGNGPLLPSLYAVGRFSSMSGVSSGNIARWVRCTCYANCDLSTSPPTLNANDFQCFLNKFAAQDAYANCDGSTAPPALNANDFQCFLNKFAAGCD